MRGLYAISELLRAGKVIAQGIGQIGTELLSDHDLTLHAAARLLFGSQVAAAYLFDQLDPKSADATRLDMLAELYGLSFARPATKARGLAMILTDLSAPYTILAGTELPFPAEAFHDGVARTFVTLEDVDCPGLAIDAPALLGTGSGIHKLRPRTPNGVSQYVARDVAQVRADGNTSTWLVAVRTVSADDQSLTLVSPLSGSLRDTNVDTVKRYATGVVVPVGCTVEGATGNVAPTRAEVELTGFATPPRAILLEMGGGGDEVGEANQDAARTVRFTEDAMACPPGFGNAQHLRELVLACPDVALDDAIVYQHLRAPTTAEIVCIGLSGSMRAADFPSAHLEYVAWGNNTRRIGEVQAARVEGWLKPQLSYFDDVRVRSVEWDYRGNTFAESGYVQYLQAVTRVDLNITPGQGYGPDAGVVLDVTPHTRDASKLYPRALTMTIPRELEPGHRVWAAVGHRTTTGRHPFATVVTEVLSVAHDRSYATIVPVSGLLPPNHTSIAVPGTDQLDLTVLRWGTAGPITEPVLDAVFAYFDALGPGSYPIAPKGPGYVQRFYGDTLSAPKEEPAIVRWPPEGRRFNSGLRGSELRAAVLAVEGVVGVRVGKLADDLVDCDPIPLHTLSLNGCLPRYS